MARPKPNPPPTPPVTNVLRDNQWYGEDVFVIGGGPSLKGFDPERLSGRRVIACNMAWRWPCAEIAYFKDQRLVARESSTEEWKICSKPLLVLDHWGRNRHHTNCYFVNKVTKQGRWGRSLEEGVYNARNTGVEAVNLADILGAKTICLLGFDMNCPSGGYQNWHTSYPKQWVPKVHGDLFNRWRNDWDAIHTQIRARVVNLNPESSLEYFEKMTPEAAGI